MTARIRDWIVPASARSVHVEYDFTFVTACCGRCGHQQETRAECRTSTCKGCGRTMRLDRPAAGNVTPIRTRGAANGE